MSWFDSRRYRIIWEVMGLERGPLSLMSTTEEVLKGKSSGSGLEIREYGLRDPSRWLRGTALSTNVGTNFADKRRSLVDWGHGVFNFVFLWFFNALCLQMIFDRRREVKFLERLETGRVRKCFDLFRAKVLKVISDSLSHTLIVSSGLFPTFQDFATLCRVLLPLSLSLALWFFSISCFQEECE
jgi:hypothetical protein